MDPTYVIAHWIVSLDPTVQSLLGLAVLSPLLAPVLLLPFILRGEVK